MSARAYTALVALLTMADWYWAAPRPLREQSSVMQKNPISPPPSHIVSDATEVFQKAFWKRPTSRDLIFDAECREWTDLEGIKKWQWFIVLEPSPDLVMHLRQDNAFNLAFVSSSSRTLRHLPRCTNVFTTCSPF